MEMTKFPRYKRGEIILFSELDFNFISDFMSNLGYKLIDNLGYGFVLKIPEGKEHEIGKTIASKYPEFFTGYQRRDINLENAYNQCVEVINLTETLRDSLGTKFFPFDWNNNIDLIIGELEKLKHQ